MTRRKRIVSILCTIIVCIGCDQITKALAKARLPGSRAPTFAGDALRLDYRENKGAVLTFEYSLPPKWRGSVFTTLVSLLLGTIILYMLFAPSPRFFSIIALSLFCGGSSSNLFDRIAYGVVVDFLNIGWGGFRSGFFNVADIAVSLGSVLIGLGLAWRFPTLLFRTPAKRTG